MPRNTSDQLSTHRTGWYVYDSLELGDYPDGHFDGLKILDDFDLEAALRDGLNQVENATNGESSDNTTALDIVDNPDLKS